MCLLVFVRERRTLRDVNPVSYKCLLHIPYLRVFQNSGRLLRVLSEHVSAFFFLLLLLQSTDESLCVIPVSRWSLSLCGCVSVCGPVTCPVPSRDIWDRLQGPLTLSNTEHVQKADLLSSQTETPDVEDGQNLQSCDPLVCSGLTRTWSA